MSKRLVLWDIDQTLIDLRGMAREWYSLALAEVSDVPFAGMSSYFGRTERAITAEVLASHGLEPSEELIQKFWAALVSFSERSLPTLAERGLALPGAGDTLAALAAQDGVVQSLVTGNLREIAWHKLAAFDLHPHIDFDLGGYGSLSAQRADLVGYAIKLAAQRHGEPESVVVVGDTPHDIEAALAHDTVAVGVATGRFDAEALHEAGAHAVLPDLSDTPTVLAALHSGS